MTTDWKRWICLAWLLLIPITGNAATPMVSASDHVLALRSDGTVYAWGRNSWGELGDGTTSDRASPIQVMGLSNVKSVLATGENSFAVKQDGTVFSWGVAYGRTLVQLPNLSNVVAVATKGTVQASGEGLLSLKTDGTVQAGFDTVPVQGLANITAIAGGGAHVLALRSDGTVWAWGSNFYGQLGDGTTTNRPAPVQVSGLSGVVAISAGTQHSLALKADGAVWAWGYNASAQLGDGTTTNRLTPVLVQGLSNVTLIAAGNFHSAAIRADGTMWDWGQSSIRGLRVPPGPVPGISNAIAVAAASNSFTIVLIGNGTLFTWGNDNSYGQFGYGSFGQDYGRIYQVVSLNLLGGETQNALPSAVFTITPEGSGNTFTVRSDASNSSDPDGSIVAYAWTTSNGQIATGQTPTFNFNQPGSYSIGLTVTDNRGGTAQSTATVLLPQASAKPAIAKGSGQALAIKSDGTLLTWGNNDFGQLGTGTTNDSAVPGLVAFLNSVKAVAGSAHSLALRQDGTVWAWGDNLASELGTGSRFGRSLVPLKVLNLTDVKAIAAGWNTSLAVKSDGTVWQWGLIAGQTTNTSVSVPSQVQGLTNVIAVAAGLFHKLALKGDGTVWAWGDNQYGQLGDGSTTTRAAPVQVPGLHNVVTIAAGGTYSLALQSDGSVWIWGDNRYGQLGIAATTPVVPPIQVQGLNQVVGIAGGNPFSVHALPLALRADGTVYHFGYNSRSQIPGLQGIIAVADGVALRSDGTVFTWDDYYFNNSDGSLGDGTFARRDGLGLVINQDVTGFLDLIPEVANNIPPDKIPPFFLVTYKSGDLSALTLAADIRGITPTGTFASAIDFVNPLVAALAAGGYNVYVAASVPTSGYFQLDSSNRWSVLTWPMAEYIRGVALDSQDAVIRVNILQNVDLSAYIGASILVGYGTSPDEMLSSARYRTIFTVPAQ